MLSAMPEKGKKTSSKKAAAEKSGGSEPKAQPEIDLTKALEALESRVARVEEVGGQLARLEERFEAFLAGLSDNFGKEWIQSFRTQG